MLDKIKREITYIKKNQYGFKTAITINDKEYCESEVCIDGTYTVYPESLDDQLQRLIPDIDTELIEEFVDDIKNAVTAYSISVYPMSSKVEIYEVSICPRCGCISVNRIDWYEKYNWYTTRIAKAEEEELRKQGAVTLAEAYKELEVWVH